MAPSKKRADLREEAKSTTASSILLRCAAAWSARQSRPCILANASQPSLPSRSRPQSSSYMILRSRLMAPRVPGARPTSAHHSSHRASASRGRSQRAKGVTSKSFSQASSSSASPKAAAHCTSASAHCHASLSLSPQPCGWSGRSNWPPERCCRCDCGCSCCSCCSCCCCCSSCCFCCSCCCCCGSGCGFDCNCCCSCCCCCKSFCHFGCKSSRLDNRSDLVASAGGPASTAARAATTGRQRGGCSWGGSASGSAAGASSHSGAAALESHGCSHQLADSQAGSTEAAPMPPEVRRRPSSSGRPSRVLGPGACHSSPTHSTPSEHHRSEFSLQPSRPTTDDANDGSSASPLQGKDE
mmetsp:Transcript_71246/g.231477  ORF Transcript_71246/g.231477 Transcript_71246/m.231477 type:complete len:355 (+) Transcript_71246:839-1903(+)